MSNENEQSQAALVARQFGSQAAAYLASPVHSQGEDLRRLATLVDGAADASVLDLGCGGGHVSFAVAPHVREVVAYDLSPEMLGAVAAAASQRGLANLHTERGTVEALPFAPARFDFVFSRYSAHHWTDFEVGLREAARVLKPGGRAVFIDVVAPGRPLLDTYLQAIELLRDPSHVRDYRRAEWEAALERAGFVPGEVRQHRVWLEFASWIERMRTPAENVAAIRSLQRVMAAAVQRHFSIEADGSFSLDVGTFEVMLPG